MTDETEEWRDIRGWEDRYQVSSFGRVRSLPSQRTKTYKGKPYVASYRGKIKRPDVDPRDGWPRVGLYGHKDKADKLYSIARLVAAAFIDPRAETTAFDFVDGDPGNCRPSNIRLHYLQAKGEVWKPIAGWSELYEVSSLGRIRSRARVTEKSVRGRKYLSKHPARIMKTFEHRHGYPAIVLQLNGKTLRATIHTLVCEAFHGPRPLDHECCHIDGNPKNASAANLRWGTKADNCRDKIITGFAALAGISASETEALIIKLSKKRAA